MIIGNVKSHEDLRKKKQLQQDLLEVEVANEAEMERRVKDFKNPYVPKPVPQKQKTRAELMKDVMELTSSLINKFRDIDVSYEIAKGAIQEFGNDPDSLVKLNALFPSIRRKLLEASIPSLLTSEQILDVARPILRRSELAYGFTIDKPSFKSPQELASIYGIEQELLELKNDVVRVYGETNKSINTETAEALNRLIEIYPDIDFFEALGTPDISEEERHRYFSELENAFLASGIPTMDICERLQLALRQADSTEDKNLALKAIRRAVSNATPEKLSVLERTIDSIKAKLEEAPQKTEAKLSKRHIEQFGADVAEARARAQGESGDRNEEDELENIEGALASKTEGAKPVGLHRELSSAELELELGRLERLRRDELQNPRLTREQRLVIEVVVQFIAQGITKFGLDKFKVDNYLNDVLPTQSNFMDLMMKLDAKQKSECFEIIDDIGEKMGLVDVPDEANKVIGAYVTQKGEKQTPEDFLDYLTEKEAYSNPNVVNAVKDVKLTKKERAKRIAELDPDLFTDKYGKKPDKYGKSPNVRDPFTYDPDAQQPLEPDRSIAELSAKRNREYEQGRKALADEIKQRRVKTYEELEEEGRLRAVGRRRDVAQSELGYVGERVRRGQVKQTQALKERRDTAQAELAGMADLSKYQQDLLRKAKVDAEIASLEKKLLDSALMEASIKFVNLKPAEKKLVVGIRETQPSSSEIDLPASQQDRMRQARLKLAEQYRRLEPEAQERVDRAVEAREDIADFVSEFVAEEKEGKLSLSKSQETAEEMESELFTALSSSKSAEQKQSAVLEVMAEKKEELQGEAKYEEKAKPIPAPQVKAVSKAEAEKSGLPVAKARQAPVQPVAKGGIEGYFKPTEESVAKKSVKNKAVIQKATQYFNGEFLPELQERDEAQRRALLRNIVIKILSDTGDTYEGVLPNPAIFDSPLSPQQEGNVIGALRMYYVDRQESLGGSYVPNATGKALKGKPSAKNPPLKKGLGMKKKKKQKDLESSDEGNSSSDEEKAKPIPIKKFMASRIKVGKGIEVQEAPKYKQFGKYVVHIPQLHSNKLNLKYPKSLGTIPSIKPTPISEEYRDFIIDVLDSGKMNEKELRRLNELEQKHFEKIVMGAGLVETLKLKKTSTKDEKEEADRFNLLRGEYLAGNNAPTLLKELRSFILKFMDDGRIKRKDGMGLLAELAVAV